MSKKNDVSNRIKDLKKELLSYLEYLGNQLEKLSVKAGGKTGINTKIRNLVKTYRKDLTESQSMHVRSLMHVRKREKSLQNNEAKKKELAPSR